MPDVTSLEISRDLSDTFGWIIPQSADSYYWHMDQKPHLCNVHPHIEHDNTSRDTEDKFIPAFSLGFLIRQLNGGEYRRINFTYDKAQEGLREETWWCSDQITQRMTMASSPENAAGLLALEMHQMGILPGRAHD